MNSNLLNIKTYADLLVDTENTWDYPDDEVTYYFDTKYVGDEKVEYEIIFGSEKIVFIKIGAGGSIRGYENKYIRMAQRIHEHLGATVICASNPDVPHEKLDEEEVRWVIAEKELSEIEVYFVGISDGAYHNLSLARRFPETVRLIGINTSYIDLSGLEERLLALPRVCKILIYGTEDDDFHEVVPALRKIVCNNFAMKIVDGADHNFTGMSEDFVSLADWLYDL